MSADTTDDLEHAESIINSLKHALTALYNSCVYNPNMKISGVYRWVTETEAMAIPYCRPTCGQIDSGECVQEEDDCGCPCHG